MDHTATHDVAKDVRRYLIVFIALLGGTLLTVTMYYVHLPSVALTIAIALLIATIKASLVAGFFMHLISERKAIYAILAATFIFFAGLMCLTVWSRDATPKGTVHWEGDPSPKTALPAGQP
jgi:cytochrome c oxidase subunit 4